jgi:plasmid stability protein
MKPFQRGSGRVWFCVELVRGLKRQLRVRAAEHGRSVENEARAIPRQAVGSARSPKTLGKAFRARFAANGCAEWRSHRL